MFEKRGWCDVTYPFAKDSIYIFFKLLVNVAVYKLHRWNYRYAVHSTLIDFETHTENKIVILKIFIHLTKRSKIGQRRDSLSIWCFLKIVKPL